MTARAGGRGRGWRALLAAGAAILALGAAGPRPGAAPPAAKSHTVEMKDMKFAPARIEVAVGDTVVWRNDDMVPHTATADGKGWDSGAIQAGKSWMLVVRKKGSVPYHCAYHPTMKGEIVVR